MHLQRSNGFKSFHFFIQAVGELFVSRSFFMTATKEDPTTKIVELAALLKYPNTISKSHLKSGS